MSYSFYVSVLTFLSCAVPNLCLTGPSAPVATGGKDKGNSKVARQSVEHAYGSPFVRAVLPHHTLGAVPTPSVGVSSSASVASKR